jgi:cytidylate kinase
MYFLPKPSTIAIDGPAAAGKSTIGYELAQRLDYLYLDTGVMYRAVTWAALGLGLDIADQENITALAERLRIDVLAPTADDGRQYTVLADDQDVTWHIREAAVEAGVSPVSAYPGVREALVSQQRRIGARGRVVMVGRDIGTIVLPDAELKLYLDACPQERARRRYRELVQRGQHPDYDRVLDGIRRRDKIDSGRQVAPLQAAGDAVVIDTSHLSIPEVLERIETLIHAQESDARL